VSLVCLFVLVGSYPRVASAQAPDAVGIRAQGMSGAFTAVADDATASWWNPAGVAGGAYLNLIVEYGQATDFPNGRPSHAGFSVAFPALGLSYYRMTVSQIPPPASTAGSSGGRLDPGTAVVRSLDVSQLGATVGQSIGNHLVVASTVKLMRAAGDTQGDLDVGALVMFGSLRAGVTVRNLRETSFAEDGLAIDLRRQVRAGAALTSATSTAYGGVTLAFDADLREVPTALGDERRLAGGAEVWTNKRRFGLRGGVSASTVGETRAAVSGGASVAVKSGLFVEAQLTGGSDELRKGWGASFRVTF
jgi:hypothetical protein